MSIVLLTKLVNAIESGASGIELASITSEARVYLDRVAEERINRLAKSEFSTDEFRDWLADVLVKPDGVINYDNNS